MRIVINKDLVVEGISASDKQIIIDSQTFSNPAYKEALKFRRRTWGIPKNIKLYEETEEGLVLPRGAINSIVEILDFSGEIIDKTTFFPPKKILSKIVLRENQGPWIKNAIENKQGIGVGSAGCGKTIMGLQIIAERGQPTLWLTHRQGLVNQFIERAEEFLDCGEVGVLGAKSFEFGDLVSVGMIPTLVRRDLSDISNNFGLVIIDECHHVPSYTFTSVIRQLNPCYLYGLTATDYRRDKLDFLMYQFVGDTIAVMDKGDVVDAGNILLPTIYVSFLPARKKFLAGKYQKIIKEIQEDESRNETIIRDIITEAALGNICMVLTTTIEHGRNLANRIKELGLPVEHISSKVNEKNREEMIRKFIEYKTGALITTYSLLAEGFDHKPANRLFMASPIRNKGLIVQALGRISRSENSKVDAIAYDYVDDIGVLRRQFAARKIIYEEEGLEIKYK